MLEKMRTDGIRPAPHDRSLSENLEDYLKIIFQLERRHRVARVKAIAEQKGVKMASVTGALQRLATRGLVHYHARALVELTDEGRELAYGLLQCNEFLALFFGSILCIDEETAREDACALEHRLSPASLGKLVALYQFIESSGLTAPLRDLLLDGIRGQVPVGAPDDTTLIPLSDMASGTAGRIARLTGGAGPLRELLERGVYPPARVVKEAHLGGIVRVRHGGAAVRLTEVQARDILVEPEDGG